MDKSINSLLNDMAGEVGFRLKFFQTKGRINYLIDKYLNDEALCDRLEDLSEQFINPHQRQWSNIDWQDIDSEQIIGLELDIFLSIFILSCLYPMNRQAIKQISNLHFNT